VDIFVECWIVWVINGAESQTSLFCLQVSREVCGCGDHYLIDSRTYYQRQYDIFPDFVMLPGGGRPGWKSFEAN